MRVAVLMKLGNYEDARVKLTNNQLKELESSARNKTGTILKITEKLSSLIIASWVISTNLTKNQIWNSFANNMLTDTKLSKAQLTKIIQVIGFLGALLGKLAHWQKLKFFWLKMVGHH